MADIPKIRFKGFTEPWEQRKLIDVCDYVDYRGKTPTKTDSGVFLVTAKNVKDGYIDYGVSQEYISEDDYEEVMHRGKPEIGDVLITTEAPCGNVAQVNRADIALAQRIIKYRGQSNIVDNTYLKDYLQSPEFQNILNAKSSGGTVKGIKGSILHQQEIKYPKYEEQFKIGSYFNNLDNLITLHQRKCDDTKELKKYMLQKMFPKNGEKFPEIRFKGFTEAWEQRKLGEVLKERTERAKGDEELLSVTIANGVIRQIDSEKRNTASEDRSNYKIVKKGDVPYNSMRMWQGAVGNSKYNGIVSPAYTILTPTPEANGKFFMELFKKKSTLQIFQRWSQGLTSDTWNLKYPILSSIQFAIPSVEEQEKIAEYFSSLDHLITLHQRKCDTLKELKKYMLQNMFPKKG